MQITPNPRIALHTAKLDLSKKVLSPISYKYLSIFNETIPTKRHKNASKLDILEDMIKSCKKHALSLDDLLKHFANIPHRNISKATEVIPNLHLSFSLLWTQLALLLASSQENKPLYQVVANVPDKLLTKAIKSATNKTRKTTVVRELLRLVFKKLPVDIALWAVFELGSKQDGPHIHIIAMLDDTTKQKLNAVLSSFESVRFKSDTAIDGKNIPIDIGAANYFAKLLNQRYNDSNNLFVTPALRIKAKAIESEYRDFITDNKPFLLNKKKAIQRSIEAYQQRRIDKGPKTYKEWVDQVLNQPTEELDPTVYWENIEDDPLRSLHRLITSLEQGNGR